MSKPPPPALPDLTDDDLKEIFGSTPVNNNLPKTVYALSRIPRDTLDAMPYIERQWCCAAKDCSRQTTIRDYGHPTHFYWHRRWTSRQSFYLCSRHAKIANERGWASSIYWTSRPPFELRSREEAATLLGHKPIFPQNPEE